MINALCTIVTKCYTPLDYNIMEMTETMNTLRPLDNEPEIVAIQEDTAIQSYKNNDIETATNSVVDDPKDVAVPTTGNIFADHRHDIEKIAYKHNVDMSVATSIWAYEYFGPGKRSDEILYQQKQWMNFLRHVTLCTDYTIKDILKY